MSTALILAATVAAAPALDYHPVRTPAARIEFMKANPCPANGKTRGVCPGYVVDYVKPLCAGGANTPHNMQWLTVADAKIKAADKRRQCRAQK
jgi:hypothetical protein